MHVPHEPCKCTPCAMRTLVTAEVATAALDAAAERLRSAESLEAATESLGPAAGWVAAAESLGPAEGWETAAAYELGLITAWEVAAQDGSWSSAV